MKAAKLITALALLGLHGAAGDDLCAPASTSAARRAPRPSTSVAHRVYAAARRASRVASTSAARRAPRTATVTVTVTAT